MSNVIEENVNYRLYERKTGLCTRIQLIPRYGNDGIKLTPFGAAELARQLLNWAVNNDKQLADRYPSFLGPLSDRM